jgi:hypothetical protein
MGAPHLLQKRPPGVMVVPQELQNAIKTSCLSERNPEQID